ncbi:protein of unknown function [Pustulibacterium marinum]|uniref:DUF3857 domain-containing protein n=1 Tax=Pustulibacterium marinum TaxID=1224947 RepID=A0A1I7GNE4_9FLAO|nr:DUF3857 domain-containing protein [Pustulibacterium marinum]SFU49786.1 protein of unknown function [Pustulibacterium marinum]
MNKTITALAIGLLCYVVNAQEYPVAAIAEDLKENADAVVRLENTKITIQDQRNMTVDYKRVITVLNEQGDYDIDAYLYYNPSIDIQDVEVLILDASGEEIEKFKKKDLGDRSVVSGFYGDNRVKYLGYTATSYPYTVVFTYNYETSRTAFLDSWNPISSYYLSTEKSEFEIHAPANLGLHSKESNLENFAYDKQELADGYTYTANHITAIKPEDYCPPSDKLFPSVAFALTKFHLEGVDGEASDWATFGKWMYDNLLKDTYDLSDATKAKMKALVADKSTTYEKAKAVFEYVQKNTRYISIQVGIGGWKPMLASEVDNLGYGDCKALTNYTKNLMDAAGITSYYTVVAAGSEKKDIDANFTAIQGNHIILEIPTEEEDVWVDCTSQVHPFNFIGDFTDDRDVLVIKPEGGEIVRTVAFLNEDNWQETIAHCKIDTDGNLIGDVEIKTSGTQYDNRFGIERIDTDDKEKYYKKYWDNLNHLSLNTINFENNKDKVEFSEKISLSAANYLSFSGDMGLFVPNAFNVISSTPDRYRNRTTPLYIRRGFLDKDTYEIEIPTGMKIDVLPEPITMDKEFGVYKMSVSQEGQKLIYHREYGLKAGTYPKEKYSEFRKFMRAVSKADGAKIVINKTT